MKDKDLLAKIDLLKDQYGTDFKIMEIFANTDEILSELITEVELVELELFEYKTDVSEYIKYMDDMKQNLLNQLNDIQCKQKKNI